MVTEDYPPFLINKASLVIRIMGLRMECIGFFIFARGPRRFIGSASFSLGQGDGPANGAYFQTLSDTLHKRIEIYFSSEKLP